MSSPRQAPGVARLLSARGDGVTDLEDAHVLEARADPGQCLERLALQDLGAALREGGLGGRDGFDALAVAVEQREEDGVGASGLAQDVEALADHRIGVAGGDVLEVDRDFGAGKVDAERRPVGPLLPQLRGQHVRSREVGKRFALHLRHPDELPLFSRQCLSAAGGGHRNQLTNPASQSSTTCAALCQKRLGMQGNHMYFLWSLCQSGRRMKPDLTMCGLPSASRWTFQRR